jgi:transcriptional regulator with XRE-family HTH domain
MYESLGPLLVTARAQLGWDQARLARELRTVGQQTVSRWERGKSRPQRAMITRIATVLDLDARQLLAAAGYEVATDTVAPPVRPLLNELPFDRLSEDVFEHCSTALAGLIFPDAAVHGWGSRGHKQDGIDIQITRADGTVTGIQCKRMKEFGRGEVQKAVDALTADVDECIIFLARVASPGARKEIDQHPTWRLWDLVDLSRQVRSATDRDRALRLVDTYFPRYREDFLGITEPGPWLTGEEYFRSFAGSPILNYDRPLVGRLYEAGQLTAFMEDPAADVALLVGAGGTGKTRLLRHACGDADRLPGVVMRFVDPHVTPGPAQVGLLPPAEHPVIVIEDAHDRSDVATIMRTVRRARPGVRFILAVRPYGLADLTRQLRAAGVLLDGAPRIELGDLGPTESRELARRILGPDASFAVVDSVASLAPDCPLIMIVAATLINRGILEGGRLTASPRIRAEVMAQFTDVLTSGSTVGDPTVRAEVLNGVAVLQPFRIDDDGCRAALVQLTGRPFDQLMRYLNDFEQAGVFLRRGTAYRVVPDLLGDALMATACVHSETGVVTGYLERVFAAADGTSLANVFVNVNRVDWQIDPDAHMNLALADPLWDQVAGQFEDGGTRRRFELLRLLRKVAVFQPTRTVAFVRQVLADLTDSNASPDSSTQDRQVRRELPALLEGVACHLHHLPLAADLLWELALDDSRPLNPHPEHPVRVLQRLAGYSPTTPLAYSEALLAAGKRWLAQPEALDAPYSPFDILEMLLATEATDQVSDGLSLTISTYPVALGVVRRLRDQVTDIAFQELRAQDPKRAVRAARALGHGLVYSALTHVSASDDAAGGEGDDDGADGWTAEFVAMLRRIGEVGEQGNPAPVVVVALREVMRWHYQHSRTATRAAAQAAWSRLPTSLEHDLALVLHDGWGVVVRAELANSPEPGDHVAAEQAKDALFDQVIADAVTAWPGPQLVENLEQALLAETRAFGRDSASATPFIWTLSSQCPDVAEQICDVVTDNPDSVLCTLVSVTLGRLLQADGAKGMATAQRLLDTRNLGVARMVASTFGWGRGNRPGLVAGEADLLNGLVAHDDQAVRRCAAAACQSISKIDPALATQLVTRIRLDTKELADEVAAVFGSHGGLRWTDLTEAQRATLVARLTACPSLDGYNIALLIEEIGQSHPETAIEIFTRRIQIWEGMESENSFIPVPHVWSYRPHFGSSPQYGDLLLKVVTWLAGGLDSWKRKFTAPELFAMVSENYDQETVSVLRATLESDDVKLVSAVGIVLGAAPQSFVWDHVEFVTDALRTAQRHGTDCVVAIGGGLRRSAISGFYGGTPGQPFPADIERRDRATAILAQLPQHSVEADFYRTLILHSERQINSKDLIDTRLADRREW